MNYKKYLNFHLFLLLVVTCNVLSKNAESFTTSIPVLDKMTKNFTTTNNKKTFDKSLSNYTLYRALVLNDFILFNKISLELPNYFCKKDKDELMKLLKWKVVVNHKSTELKRIGIKCDEQIEASKGIMEDYFLNVDFYDAQIEYYNYLVSLNKGDFLLKNSLLRMVMYSKPDITVLELLIDNLQERKLVDGEWNASILAARYGSTKGLTHMIKLLEHEPDIEFMKKVYDLLGSDTALLTNGVVTNGVGAL